MWVNCTKPSNEGDSSSHLNKPRVLTLVYSDPLPPPSPHLTSASHLPLTFPAPATCLLIIHRTYQAYLLQGFCLGWSFSSHQLGSFGSFRSWLSVPLVRPFLTTVFKMAHTPHPNSHCTLSMFYFSLISLLLNLLTVLLLPPPNGM